MRSPAAKRAGLCRVTVPLPDHGPSKLALEEAEERREAMQEQINLLHAHPGHAHHMLSHLKKRLEMEENDKKEVKGIGLLAEFATVGALCSIKNEVPIPKYE